MKKVEIRGASMSKVRVYLRCPRRYYYSYGEGIFEPPTPATRFGTYLHAVLEDYIRHLVQSNKKQDPEALYALAQKRRAEFAEIPETGKLSFADADVMINRFASRPVDPERVYAIEKGFKLPVARELEVNIEGRIDRIDIEYRKGEGGLLHIIDYKSGVHKLSEEELADDLQMKFYVLASYLLFRKRYRDFRFSLFYLRDNTTVSFETEYRKEFREAITGYIRQIKRDEAYEKKPGKQCKYCPAFKQCKPDLGLFA